jgi:hypothetical protein
VVVVRVEGGDEPACNCSVSKFLESSSAILNIYLFPIPSRTGVFLFPNLYTSLSWNTLLFHSTFTSNYHKDTAEATLAEESPK